MSNQSKTIQQKTEELKAMVAWFDGDDFKLEEALEKFKQAEVLAAEIEKDLLSLKNEVMVIKKKFDEQS